MSLTNQEGRQCSAQPTVTQTIMLRCLRLFGHIIRSDSDEDHTCTCALNAGIDYPSKEWRRPCGRPRQSTDVASYCRVRPQTTASWAVVGPAQSVRPRSVARHCGSGDTPRGACHMMMMPSSVVGVDNGMLAIFHNSTSSLCMVLPVGLQGFVLHHSTKSLARF